MSRLDKYQQVGLDKLATLQVLNKQKRGLFLKDAEKVNAGWTATPKELKKGVTFDHTHKFGLTANKPESGILFQSINLLIIHRSPLLIEDKQNNNILIGELGNPNITALFQEDKASATGENKRRYSARSKWLVFILDDQHNLAASNPVVLSAQGLASVDLSKAYTECCKAATSAINSLRGNALNNIKQEDSFYRALIFSPTFVTTVGGAQATEYCGVKSQVLATPATLESRLCSEPLENLMTQLLSLEAIQDFYLNHSHQISAELGGAYGVATGYLKASTPRFSETGEDFEEASLLAAA